MRRLLATILTLAVGGMTAAAFGQESTPGTGTAGTSQGGGTATGQTGTAGQTGTSQTVTSQTVTSQGGTVTGETATGQTATGEAGTGQTQTSTGESGTSASTTGQESAGNTQTDSGTETAATSQPTTAGYQDANAHAETPAAEAQSFASALLDALIGPVTLVPSPAAVSFRAVARRHRSAARTVRITNRDHALARLGARTIRGRHAADFTVTKDTCRGATLQRGASCTLTITAKPAATGRRRARIGYAGMANGLDLAITGARRAR